MKKKDQIFLEEAYQKVCEGIYEPEIQQALNKANQLLKAKQLVDPAIQAIVAKDPRASSSLVKIGIDNGVTSKLEQHFSKDIWNSIKSNKNISGELHNWLNKHNLQVDQLLSNY